MSSKSVFDEVYGSSSNVFDEVYGPKKEEGKPNSFFNRPKRAPGGVVGAVARNPGKALAEAGSQAIEGLSQAFTGNVKPPAGFGSPQEENLPSFSDFIRQKSGVSELPELEREELQAFGILANVLAPFIGEAGVAKLKGLAKPKANVPGGSSPPPGTPPKEPYKSVFSKGLGSEGPPPGGSGPGKFEPGSVLPETKSSFGEKEQIIKDLHKVETPPKLGIEAKVADTTAKATSLQGRVSEAQELGRVIAKEPFETEAQSGRSIAKEVTAERNAERGVVKEKYKSAEEVTATHNAPYAKLAQQNEERIHRLEQLEKRSAGEEAVYQDALALRRMIGEPHGLIETNADRLMKQANSFSQKINFELPYAGYKGEIKTIVHEMNQAVIESLEHAGKNAAAVKEADRTFARFADRFMGDEISPYFNRKILNPEELGKKAISDPSTYRAVKKAIGERGSDLVNKIDREVVHQAMDKYFKDPSKVNSKEYVKDLKNLAEKIGKGKTSDVDHFLRQKQLNAERKTFAERKLKESDLSKQGIKGRETEKPKSIELKKPIAKTPEQLDKLFKSRSDIRRLKREMKDKGLSKQFDKLSEDKIEEIFKEGGFGAKKVTGTDLKRIIDKDHEILSELLGEEEVSLLYKVASKAGKEELTQEIIKQVVKATGKLAANFLGIGKLIKLIPLNRI